MQPATQRATHALPLGEVARVEMPALDNDALIARDEAASLTAEPGPFRFAEPFDADLSTASAGTWETLSDGTRVWRLVVSSPGAYSLNFGFTRFRLPEGAALWLYPAGEAPHFRAFTHADNEDHDELWTPIIRGDEVVVELNLPPRKPGAAPDFELELAQVNHAYRPFGVRAETAEDQARSGSCHVDVACSEGDGYRDVIRSVGLITYLGVGICSGSALNNTAGDGTPYFLTAHHCGANAENSAGAVFYWNYENSTCREPGSPESGGPGDGRLFEFSTGSTFLGSSSGSDWSLVELDDPIPPEYGVFLNGWDRRDQATSSAVGVHHPRREEKRISFEDDPTSITGYLGTTVPGDGTHLRVDWDHGTVESGSSGSPLFSPEKRVVGQLHGGHGECDPGQRPYWYGRMAHSMDTGLAAFLDPEGTGVAFIDGMEAGTPPGPVRLVASMVASPGSVSPGGTTTVSVEVFNDGSEPAEGVSVEDGLPSPLAFAGNLAASSGTASEAGGVVTWLVDVAAGGSETVSFDVTVDAEAPAVPVTNTALVTHPSLVLPHESSAVVDVFVAPDFYYANEEDHSIPDFECPSFTTSEIEVTDAFVPLRMKVGVGVQHSWRGDLRIRLTSPEGTTVRLLERLGSGDVGWFNLDALFSDSGPADVFGLDNHDPAPPFYDVEGQTQGSGAGPLAAFLAEDPQGTWTLSVCDEGELDVGTLIRWALLFYTEPSTNAEGEAAMAEAYRIEAPYPNPFADETLVRLTVREAQHVRAEVYDALGRRVGVLHDGPFAAGVTQTLRLDGRGLTGGVYVVRFKGDTFTASRKVLLVK